MQWEFFKEVLNDSITPSQEMQYNEDFPPPTRAEMDKAIQRLKTIRVQVRMHTDGILNELLKTTGGSFNRILHQILTKIWSSEKMPSEWVLSLICLVFKKGD